MSDSRPETFSYRTKAKILEYAHGGTEPIAALSDDGGYNPNGCAV